MARVASGAGAGISGLVQVRLDSVTNPPVGDFALTFSSGQPADFVNVNWFTFGH